MERWEVHGILGGDLSAHSMPQQGVQYIQMLYLRLSFPVQIWLQDEHDT